MRRSTALTAAAAALLLLAVSLAAAYMERSEFETRRMFRDWMAKFSKTYGSIGEEEHRYKVYKENLRRMAGVKTSFDAGSGVILNGFGDLTEQELSSIYPGHGSMPDLNKDPPYSVDWSKKGTGGRGQAVSM